MKNFSDFNQVLLRKVFEISYALMRVAGISADKTFSSYLEKYAFDLIDRVVSGDLGEAISITTKADFMLRLGSEMGLVAQTNFQVLESELNAFNSAMRKYADSAKLPELDVTSIFSADGKVFSDKLQQEAPAVLSRNGDTPTRTFADFQDREEHFKDSSGINMQVGSFSGGIKKNINEGADIEEGEVPSRQMRQSAILDRIRQKTYCRLKDIQEIFPGSSERTLRYDLQNLIEKNSIERIGSGGPASFYRLRRAGSDSAK